MNDQEQTWVMQARRGDAKAFSRLVEAYQRPVFNLTYRMLGNIEEAEDAAQETFLRAYSRLGQYDPAMKFSTWLFSIANHHCIDRLRRRKATQISIDDNPMLQNLEGGDLRPERSALQEETRIEVQTMLERLAPEYRLPLVLRYWEEMSYEEIAETMNVTVATVKSRLFRARQQLAALYRQQENETPPDAQHASSQSLASRPMRNQAQAAGAERESWRVERVACCAAFGV
ncbi:RNA polymerase sigma factor [Caldilinea sp.]|uniref:RNA polymerase sigma factor n=1 Tax=Caldilinea sp. TaxID=2293560 RepID=UPI0021DEAEAA|nr:sigma-70 family RNA polymerase sigma factor [Caldilinea sp.]GIV68255.1 MAG: RNA polymerase subunit sigma-24 [Caldilinea sp.]